MTIDTHPRTLPETFLVGVLGHINSDHRHELLQLAHGLAGATWADEAEATHADTHGLDLLLHAADREEPLRIPFDAPIEKPNQFRPMLIGMIGRARANWALSKAKPGVEPGALPLPAGHLSARAGGAAPLARGDRANGGGRDVDRPGAGAVSGSAAQTDWCAAGAGGRDLHRLLGALDGTGAAREWPADRL